MSSWEREEAEAARRAAWREPHPDSCRCRECAREEADR